MTRSFLAFCATAGVLLAQGVVSPASEVKQSYDYVKNNILRAADKVPESDYGFKASQDVRTFGQLVGHVADSSLRACSGFNGAPKQSTAGDKTAKAELVAALKDGFAECDKAFDALTDANAHDGIAAGRGQRSRLGALYSQVVHDNEMYGYMAVYMRLKGIVPPSSEPRGGR